MTKNIFIIGDFASGKSTIGNILTDKEKNFPNHYSGSCEETGYIRTLCKTEKITLSNGKNEIINFIEVNSLPSILESDEFERAVISFFVDVFLYYEQVSHIFICRSGFLAPRKEMLLIAILRMFFGEEIDKFLTNLLLDFDGCGSYSYSFRKCQWVF